MNQPPNQNTNFFQEFSIPFNTLFNVGDLVLVDKCQRAYITSKNHHPNGHIDLTIRHVVSHTIESNVAFQRCEVITLSHSTTTRSGLIRNNSVTTQPTGRHVNNPQVPNPISTSATSTSTSMQSSMNNNNNNNVLVPNQPEVANIDNSTGPTLDEFKNCMIESCFPRFKDHLTMNRDNNLVDKHPVFCFIFKYKDNEKGWLRKLLHDETSTHEFSLKAHFNDQETMVLSLMSTLLSGSSSIHRQLPGHVNLMSHALGIERKTRKRNFLTLVEDNFIIKSADSSRKSKTIFNDEHRRKQVFTAFNSFKKMSTKKFRETSERIPTEILKLEFEALDQETKHSLGVMAQRDLVRSRSLWGELCDILLKSKGKVSYAVLANHLSNIVDKTTIMRTLKDQEGFRTRKDRILPHLDKAAQLRRVKWAETFWMFWKCVKCCPPSKVIFVLVHMDEKWFYAIVTRANCKVLTSIGLEPNDYYAHHKNHVGKELYIVVTAYVINNNDITAGGKAVPISCIRVGKMVKASKNSYKRVYKTDGSYHYPQIPENIKRRKGEEYFKPMELNGSNTGTPKKPKISLLQKYIDDIIPNIETKIVERFGTDDTKVCIVKQEDGAGLHTDRTYLNTMNDMFRVRDWLIFNQPSQSPVTNIHDACIFPMMSKAVSTEQAISFGSKMLVGEQLNQTVLKVWQDKSNTVAMSRAFA